MSNTIVQFPYNRFTTDISKNMVVPGRWFNWVTNGLGMMNIVYDIDSFTDAYVENLPNGSLTLHLKQEYVPSMLGWQATNDDGKNINFNRQSILMINQKSYYLQGYSPTPDAEVIIDYSGPTNYAAVDRLCVWVEVNLDSVGGDNHGGAGTKTKPSLETGSSFPVYSPVADSRRIIRPIFETKKLPGAKYLKFQHTIGLMTIDVP